MIDDHRVYLIIMRAFRQARGASLRARVDDAFTSITADREYRNPGDVDYAAAEHYLYACMFTTYLGRFGYAAVIMSAGSYAGAKRLMPGSWVKEFGSGPVTPYSRSDFWWMKRGADDGCINFNRAWNGEMDPVDPDDP